MRYYTNSTRPLNTIRRTLNKDTYVPESIFHLMPLCKSTKRHQVFYAALYLQRQDNQPIMQKNNPKYKLLSRLLHIYLEQPCLTGCNLIKKLIAIYNATVFKASELTETAAAKKRLTIIIKSLNDFIFD